jgi:hypothetical protein
MQQRMILRNVEMLELTLCFVDTWAKEKVTTFFGDLEFILVVRVIKGHPRNGTPSPPDEVGHAMPGERMRQGQHYQHPLPLPPSPPNVISGGRMRHVQSPVIGVPSVEDYTSEVRESPPPSWGAGRRKPRNIHQIRERRATLP